MLRRVSSPYSLSTSSTSGSSTAENSRGSAKAMTTPLELDLDDADLRVRRIADRRAPQAAGRGAPRLDRQGGRAALVHRHPGLERRLIQVLHGEELHRLIDHARDLPAANPHGAL